MSNSSYDDLINKYSSLYDIPASLLKALISVESSFNPNIISSKGAIGLMQILPSTASWFASKVGISYNGDLTNPDTNIHLGTAYLRYLIDMFNGNTDKALAAYNTGPGTVQKYGITSAGLKYVGDVLGRIGAFVSSPISRTAAATGKNTSNDQQGLSTSEFVFWLATAGAIVWIFLRR